MLIIIVVLLIIVILVILVIVIVVIIVIVVVGGAAFVLFKQLHIRLQVLIVCKFYKFNMFQTAYKFQ